jgi:hypothetical protein
MIHGDRIMINTIDEVLEFVEQKPDYRATIGLIKTKNTRRSFLTWAAVHIETGHQHVPYLSTISKLHPGARWIALTPKDLHIFLRNNKQKAFLLTRENLEKSEEPNTLEDTSNEKSA